MKNILDFAHITRKNEISPIYSMAVEYSVHENGESFYAGGFGQTQGYILRASCYSTFYCTSAEYEQAKQNAKHNILHCFYGDILGELNRIKAAAYARDFDSVLKICFQMEDDMTRVGNDSQP